MTVDELRRRYAAVMGEPSRSRHKMHPIRKMRWNQGLNIFTLALL